MAELKKKLPRDFRVEGQKIYLRPVRLGDATRRYCSWLNDPEVNRYTESRYTRASLSGLKKYISATLRSPSNFFFAMIDKSTGEHVGNIKIDSTVNPFWDHWVGEIGLIVGEKKCWGKGYGSEAIRLMTQFAFNHLKLHKVTATCLSINKGSAKAFLKAGFKQELVRKSNACYGGKFVDLLLFGVISPHCKK